ncbi:MAG: putative acetolactate synthase large subunit [Promethearchaeota archaeon]|nr:MAG: putative acetolactate synthase large subunit [Candidatus Lokiarchaeota archaeon]
MSEKVEKARAGYGIAKSLAERGIKHVFGIPDGHTLAFYEGMRKVEGIDHILMNDERSAAFAADAYARVTGMLGVCDSGAAGSMNFPVALSEAKGSASPVLAIVGTIKSIDMLRNIPHDINVSDTLSPITKWTEKVLDPEYLPRFLEYGIKTAINNKPGPTALVIAEDVIAARDQKVKYYIPQVAGSCSLNSCRPTAAQSEIDHAVDMIRNSKQPAFFTGQGTLISGAYEEIEKLSKILNAPVFSTIDGKGIMKSDHPNYFGVVGLFGLKNNHKFIRRRSDLLIVVGNRLTEDDTANFKVPTKATDIIHIDIDAADIGLSYDSWGVVGDPKSVLNDLITELEKEGIYNGDQVKILEEREENLKELREDLNRYWEKDKKKWMNAEPIKPQRILKAIADNMNENDYLVTDASSSSRWIGAYYPIKSKGRKIITPRGVGPTGFGVGALIGTCIAADTYNLSSDKPKKVLFTGDGGLMQAINELETIKKLNLDCTIVVINNSALGFVKFGQAMLYRKNYYDTDRPNTDFSKIAEAFGGKGYRIEKLGDLDPTIEKAIHSEGFTLVDVVIDPYEFLPPSNY